MSSTAPDPERRVSDVQAPMPRLAGPEPVPFDERLARLTEQCAEIVRRWGVTSERYARAVTRFETHLDEWNTAGTRLHENAAQRMQELEQVIRREAEELSKLHDQPLREMHEHTANLTQVCLATVNAAQQNFERAEARLLAIQNELSERLADFTREIHAAVAELRGNQQTAPLPAASAPWPLDGVTRLHQQLRDSSALATTGARGGTLSVAPAAALPEATATVERLETLERAIGERDTRLEEAVRTNARAIRTWRVAVGALGVLLVAVLAFAWRLSGDVSAAAVRVEQVERDARAAIDQSARDAAAARDVAAREIDAAMAEAARARLVANVLAAPDRIRYNLAGLGPLAGASAQVHFSRTRGVVFSGARIPPPQAGATYHVWLLTRGDPVSAATFSPDANGAATVAVDPLVIPRAVVGAMVTLETSSGQTPAGRTVLARPPEVQPAFLQQK